MLTLIIGAFIGATLGIVIMALCNMAKENDLPIEYRIWPGKDE